MFISPSIAQINKVGQKADFIYYYAVIHGILAPLDHMVSLPYKFGFTLLHWSVEGMIPIAITSSRSFTKWP